MRIPQPLGLIFPFLVLLGQGIAAEAPIVSIAALQAGLAARLAATHAPGASWGVEVISLESGKTLFATNADRLFVPASNTKLFTGALALDQLGPADRLNTRVLSMEKPAADGTLAGDLWIRGEGDSLISGRARGGGWKRGIEPVVAAIQAAGIKQVKGDLVADVTRFRGPAYGNGWNWDDLSVSDAPPVSPLTFNNNCVRITFAPGPAPGQPATLRLDPPWVSSASAAGDPPLLTVTHRVITGTTNQESQLTWEMPPGVAVMTVSGLVAFEGGSESAEVPVVDAAAYFARAVREGLAAAGVQVSGRIRVIGGYGSDPKSSSPPPGLQELAAIPSAPLSLRIRELMKPSDNLHAQLALLQVGARQRSVPASTTEAAGLRAMDSFLAAVGLHRTEYFFEEGSGLSRKNAVTPHAVVNLLKFMARHRAAKEWMESLPIGGVDGSLKTRFTALPTKGNVRAKTGSLRHVNALSGYVTSASGEPLAFSILVNQYVAEGSASSRREIDSLVELLANYAGPR